MISISIIIMAFLTLTHSEKVNIWGPGLFPDDITMPARYFFVEVLNSSSISGDNLSVQIIGDSVSGSCRLWLDILNRKDGTFIVRYRLYESCTNFKIIVKYKNSHVGDSPYTYTGTVYNEDCDCPKKDFDSWARLYGCPESIDQINEDMKPFNYVNMSTVLKDVVQNYNHPGSMSLCHYVLKSNELHRKCYGQHVGFHIFSDAILLSVMRKVRLPDQSFFVNLGDWPLVKKNTKLIPLFSWCGSSDTMDIVLPTYDLTESTLENMGRVMLDMLSIQGNIGKKWDEKIPQAFWRGRDSSKERLKLVDIARENPSLYNVSLTNFFFFRDKEETYGPKVPHVSFFKFFDFKYQINLDGTVAAYRFPYLLIGDSLVFKQESTYYEHFYHQLQKGKHYIPFKRDLSDLTEKILWAMENDEKARTISRNGREFAAKNLMPKDIICYYAIAFKEWAKRIVGPIEIYEGMEKVPQKDNAEQRCDCSNSLRKDEL